MSLWSDRSLPAEYVDRDAFLFCGADPSWTPAKEERRAADPDGARGKCSLCGGDGRVDVIDPETGKLAGTLKLDVAIEDGEPNVCGRCMRYGRQHLLDTTPLRFDVTQRKPPSEPVPTKPGKKRSAPAATAAEPSPVVSAGPGYVKRGGVTIPERFAHVWDAD